MIAVRAFDGRELAVFGLGMAGLAAARALEAGGARVACWDDDSRARARAAAAGLMLEELEEADWSRFDALVIAPADPVDDNRRRSVAEYARRYRIPVLSDMELFAREVARLPDANRPRVIAITGSYGKSTTTALLGHVLSRCNRDGRVAGRGGAPVLALEGHHGGAIYVLELDSAQLALTSSLKPNVSVFLNVSTDHLESEDDSDAYIASKLRIFQKQTVGDIAVIGVDDQRSTYVANEMAAANGPQVIHVSSGRTLGRGAFAVGGVLYDAIDGRPQKVADLRDAGSLQGRHNWQNAVAAYTAARSLGLEPRRIAEALLDFPGLPHRLEEVARRGPVTFVNDSKATNPTAARHALALYENVYWIAGGRSKTDAMRELSGMMPRVAKAYLIGEAAVSMAAQLKGRTIVEISRDLDRAVAAAARDAARSARADPVVLLSPACASVDQFADYQARGDAFRALVNGLPADAEPFAPHSNAAPSPLEAAP